MAKQAKNEKSLRNPIVLSPRNDARNVGVIQVVVETPKGSRNKCAFDTEQRTNFTLMRFDLSCGAIPDYWELSSS
jgi:inorganic pyrophosphatase